MNEIFLVGDSCRQSTTICQAKWVKQADGIISDVGVKVNSSGFTQGVSI